ncbi:3-oxoacyl-ACP reductase FabG [Pseudonocardia hispaniensis]|uniref:3-oxoacyl-ACP reductase FabG n=1 Tax=Pseudonocardia hispaniensis TaxID=904933 RepID=A0ABW1IZL8_9PSEU
MSRLRVLVTGGSQGIGLGIAAVFARQGARVVISGRDETRLDRARHELSVKGLPVEVCVGDVASKQGCERMAARAVELLGGLDVLCANAGIYPEVGLPELSEDDVDAMFATNLKGTIFSVQACLEALAESRRGRIVVTSSITGPATGFPGLSHYGASKAAQLGFVRSAALELAPHGITINAVLPGSIRTEGLDGLGADTIAAMERCIPQRRLGSVEDIGYAAAYFASDGAGFVTGQTLVVDGGQTLPELPLHDH